MKPKFGSKDIPPHLLLLDPGDQLESNESKSILCQSLCAELYVAALETLRFSQILRDQETRAVKLDPQAFQATLMYVGYRLLEVQLPSAVDTTFDVLMHVALMAFHNTFLVGISHTMITFPVLTAHFRSAARNLSEHHARRHRMVVLWALLMGRISLLAAADDDVWLVPKLKTLAVELELWTWAEVRIALDEFPWVQAAHDETGRIFWDAMFVPSLSIDSA